MFESIIQELQDLADLHCPTLAARQRKLLEQLSLEIGSMPPPLMAKPRSSEWSRCRAEWLEKHPSCQACGGEKHLEVHHIRPYHNEPELELSDNNLITLCNAPYHNCHFILGHLLNWSSWNKNVKEDAAVFLKKVENRP